MYSPAGRDGTVCILCSPCSDSILMKNESKLNADKYEIIILKIKTKKMQKFITMGFL